MSSGILPVTLFLATTRELAADGMRQRQVDPRRPIDDLVMAHAHALTHGNNSE